MANNLDLQTQLNQLLADQNKFLEAGVKFAKDQASLTKDMVEALKGANFKEVAVDIQNATQAVAGASEATQGLGSVNQDVMGKVVSSLQEAAKKEDEAGKGMDDLAKKVKKFSVATAAIDGFVQGLRFTGNMLHTATDAGIGLVESLTNIAASIIAIPFKMLSGLINMASSGGGDNGLRQALEDIRKEFGALHATSGKAIIDMAKGMKGELAQTGLSVYRVFGNIVEKLKTMQEYAHNLGPLFSNLAMQFVKNTEAIGAYYKGLGLTEEGQKAVATRAYALGTALTEELRQITNYSQQLSKAFNGAAGSAKEISRDMATLMADFKHFGGISTKEIGQAVVYFRRLGLEVAKVMGVIEKYDNFEDAANGAAQLSQAFNLNVDALEMMKAQNPAERVEMLRKSFFAAGRSVENMTRQERALLAQQTGLDDSALDLAFSMKNQGMSYDQVTKKADAAKKTQMTQVEAMKALADSIERLVKTGSSGSGGFIDRFIQGFTVGIQRSQEFRGLMRELRIDLRVAYTEGIKVGRAFVEMFPGVKDVFQGLKDIFEPKKFRAMFRAAAETFKEFFKDMVDNPRTALPKLLEKLKSTFFSWFQYNSQNGQRVLDGFKKFFVALSTIAGTLLKTAMTCIRDGVKYITDLITGRSRLPTAGAHGGLGFLYDIIDPILNAIEEVGPSLWNAIKGMFTVLWKKAEPWLRSNFLDILGVLAAPALIGTTGRVIAGAIFGSFTSGLFDFIKDGGITKAFNSIKNLFTKQVETAVKASNHAPATPGSSDAGNVAADAIKGAEPAAEAAAGSKTNWVKALAKMAAITVFIVVGMVGILFAIYQFAKAIQENHITPASIATASLAMVTSAVAILAIAGAVKLLSAVNINPGVLPRVLGMLLVVGGVSLAMALGAKQLIKMFGGIDTSKIAKTVTVMTATGAFFLAAAGITAIAAGVGAIAMAGSGLGALAIAAGLAAIALTVEVMAVQGIHIMNSINRFEHGPGFAENARVFVDVMKGVGSFAASVAQLVAASRPGILDFLRGAGAEEQRMNLAAVQTTIEVLSGQMVLIVETLKNSIRSLTGSEQELRAAQTLGTLLGGVAELGNALKPPTEAMQESGWYTTLTGGGEDIAAKVRVTAEFIQTVAPQLRTFMRTIGEMFTGSGAFSHGLSAEQERAAQVIPGILKGVAEFANSLRAGTTMILQTAQAGHQEDVLRSVGTYMESLIRSLSGSDIFRQIGSVVTSIASSVGSLNPNQLKAVEALAPVIGPAFTAIGNISGVLSSLAAPRTGNADPNAIFQLTTFVSTFFNRIKDDLPTMINSMKASFAGMSVADVNKFSQGMHSFTELFQVITSIPNMVKGLGEVGGIDAAFNTLRNMLASAILQFDTHNPTSFGGLAVGIVPMVNAMVLEIEKAQYHKLNMVVTGMVHEMNQLATTIQGLQPINIETGLKRLGDSLGLGADGSYTINNRNFTINVGVTVKFDNNGLDAFELALLRRVGPHGTRITHGDLTV